MELMGLLIILEMVIPITMDMSTPMAMTITMTTLELWAIALLLF